MGAGTRLGGKPTFAHSFVLMLTGIVRVAPFAWNGWCPVLIIIMIHYHFSFLLSNLFQAKWRPMMCLRYIPPFPTLVSFRPLLYYLGDLESTDDGQLCCIACWTHCAGKVCWCLQSCSLCLFGLHFLFISFLLL